MFVLRSHEAGRESVPELEGAPVAITAGHAEPSRSGPVDLAAVRQGRGRARRAAPGLGAEASEDARPSGRQAAPSMQMPLFAAAFAVRFGGANAAAECPKHLADVQALIDRVSAGVDRVRDRLSWDKTELVHALLDAARRNHEHPVGPYDHARAFAKADAALGHARAAQIVWSRSTRE